MSDLGNIYNPAVINSVDGFVTDDSVIDLNNAADYAFDEIENIIGNLLGKSLINAEKERFTTTIAGVIGSNADEYVIPSNVEFTSYTETFAANNSTDFVLRLIPTSALLINDGTHLTSYWTQQASKSDLAVDTDYCVIGRVISFYNAPSNFTVEYTGTFPIFGTDGYRPNVLPNQALRDINTIPKPTLTILGSNRYKIEIDTSSSNGDLELNSALEYSLSDYLQPYISPSGAVQCPQQYISIWLKVGDKFKKIQCSAVYIYSETHYEFVTTNAVDSDDEFAVVLANRGILEDVAAITKLLVNHSHNSADGSSPISHSELIDLIPISDNDDIHYAGSVISGNDHPQYLHREGYTPNDAGSYNNALLGDLLISSINSSSLYNNVLSDSNRLYFGAVSGGHSLKRRAIEKDLILFSTESGLTVEYDYSVIGNYGLNISGHKFRRHNTLNNLIITSSTAKTYFMSTSGVMHDIYVKTVNAEDLVVTEAISLPANGSVTIGNISLTNVGNDLILSGTNNLSDRFVIETNCEIEEATIRNLSLDTLVISPEDSILFGPTVINVENSYFTSVANEGAVFNSPKPLRFTGYGKNTGMSFNDKLIESVFGNMYTSSENGLQPTISDHNIYLETGVCDLYILQDTTSTKVVDGVTYIWDDNTNPSYTNVTNLKNWPKSNLYAEIVNAARLQMNQYSAVSSTGLNQGDNSNKTIIHADNGVLLTRSNSSVYATAAGNKADIELADINAEVIQADGITADTGIITELSIPNDGTLTVGGSTTFNGDVIFNNTLELNDDVTINANLKVLNNINGADNDGNLTIAAGGVLTIIKNTQHFGTTVFANTVAFNSPVTASSLITANAGIEVNNINVTNTLDVAGTANIANLNIVDLDADTITCGNIIATSNTDASEFKDVNVAGDLVVDQDITMASGRTLNMAGATITNLAMPISPSGTDGVNKQYVDDAVANVGTVNLLKIIYPVNSIYISSHNPSSPGEITGPFGSLAFGTWEAYAEGRVLLGSGTGTDDNGVIRTYTAPAAEGEYVHTQTLAEMASHQHKVKAHPNNVSNSGDADPWDIFIQNWEEVISGESEYTSEPLGSSTPFNVMQPFMTVYVWRRTA